MRLSEKYKNTVFKIYSIEKTVLYFHIKKESKNKRIM